MRGLQSKVLSYAIRTGRVTGLFSQLTESHFVGVNRDVFRYLLEHWGRHNAVPSLQLISERFPGFIIAPKCKPRDFPVYVDEVKNRARIASLSEMIRDSARELTEVSDDGEKVLGLVESMESRLQEVRSADSTGKIFRLRENAKTFWQTDYDKILERDGLLGYKSGIEAIDKTVHGFKPGELIAIVGFSGEGKTYLSLLLGGNVWKSGCNAALFSLEMDADTVARRMYAVLSGVSIEGYISGELSSADLRRMKKTMRSVSGWKNEMLIDDEPSLSVNALRLKLRDYQPDIAIVDYLTLMQRSMDIKDKNERLDVLVRDLKITARQFGIPIIVNAQATRDAASQRIPPKLDQVEGGMPLVKTADVIMSFVRNGPTYSVKFRKNRNATRLPSVRLTWRVGQSGLKCESKFTDEISEDI